MKREKPRVVIVSGDKRTTVDIGPGRGLDPMIFFSMWMGAWALSEIFCLYQVAFGDMPSFVRGFLCVWLALWTIGGMLTGATFAFVVFGREHIELTATTLRLDASISRWTRGKTYAVNEIARVRRNPAAFELIGMAENKDNAMLLLDHNGAVVRFGSFLEEADVRAILESFERCMPGLVST